MYLRSLQNKKKCSNHSKVINFLIPHIRTNYRTAKHEARWRNTPCEINQIMNRNRNGLSFSSTPFEFRPRSKRKIPSRRLRAISNRLKRSLIKVRIKWPGDRLWVPRAAVSLLCCPGREVSLLPSVYWPPIKITRLIFPPFFSFPTRSPRERILRLAPRDKTPHYAPRP